MATVDIHDMPYEDNSFDYVIADQVIEHVKKPWVAMEEVRRVLKPNGWAIITSCLMNGIHWGPKDFWRFTPDGLKVLCENFSNIEQSAGWGNWESLVLCHDKKKRLAQVKPKTKLHQLASGPSDNNLIHVWIIAQK
jgi:ubiquinone/menaquinone biosynthesis C-methylase UbiE